MVSGLVYGMTPLGLTLLTVLGALLVVVGVSLAEARTALKNERELHRHCLDAWADEITSGDAVKAVLNDAYADLDRSEGLTVFNPEHGESRLLRHGSLPGVRRALGHP